MSRSSNPKKSFFLCRSNDKKCNDTSIIPQTVFSCRGSYGVGKGALEWKAPRRRLPLLIFHCKYQWIRDGPSKTPSKVNTKGNFSAFGVRVVTIYDRNALWMALGSWMLPRRLLGASWFPPLLRWALGAAAGRPPAIEFFWFVSAWKSLSKWLQDFIENWFQMATRRREIS